MKRRSLLKSLLAASALLPALGAGAKSLYLTVRRDFDAAEPPVVEINYSQDTAINFRVLRPKDLKGFIAAQIDLRRAWKEPRTEHNPAYYLFRGLNESRLGVEWVRSGLDAELRDGLKESFGGGTYKREGTRLAEGPQKLISTPDNFELVQEFAVYPEGKDKLKGFDVPGFDEWFEGYGGSLQTKEVTLSKLPAGFYVLQVLQGKTEGQVVLVVNDVRAEVQQSDHYAVVRVSDRAGRPLNGVPVSLRNVAGKWVEEKKTDAGGVAEFKGVPDRELIAVVEGGAKGTAIVDTDFYSTSAVFPDVFLYTDRPMYKPGHEIHFKGVARQKTSGLAKVWKPRDVSVRVVNVNDGEVAASTVVAPTAFGTFSGEFKLPADLGAGLYRVEASIESQSHIGEFRVKDYVKPLFFAKVGGDQETLKAGGQLSATLAVKRYAGGVPMNTKYVAELFRVKMEAPQWIEDAGVGETGSQVTYGFDGADQVSTSIPILVKRVEGDFDRTGNAKLTIKVPADVPGDANYDYKFVLKVTASDEDGNFATTNKSFLDLQAEIMAQARFTAVLLTPENSAKLRVRSVYPSGKAYPQAPGKVEWWHTPYRKAAQKVSENEFTTSDAGVFETDVAKDLTGRLEARVTLYDRNRAPTTASTSLVVAGAALGGGIVDVDDLTLMTRKTVYGPGEISKALVLLPDGWGEGGSNSGTLHVTVVGTQVFETRALKVNGLSAWLEQAIAGAYGSGVYVVLAYSDPRKGWIERKLSYRILETGRILNVKMDFAQDTAFPGSDQEVRIWVRDGLGQPAKAELSLSVVDKAVLDLQPEIRPALLDFFYPLQRMNLMSFFSSQFQSYGYGESIASLFNGDRWQAAAKGEAQEEFVEKDTAYWNAHLTTNGEGFAKINFRLPANQTIWNVSAVAVDTEGRFGEGKGEFKANMPLTFLGVLPPFLRFGDQAVARFTLTNTSAKQSFPVTFALASGPGVKLAESAPQLSENFAPKSEKSFRVPFAALEPASPAEAVPEGSFTAKLTVQDKDLEFTQSVALRSNRNVVPTTYWLETDKATTVPLGPDERVSQDARAVVSSGVSGALLPSLKWLVAYPYGCVEQLVSSTVPNLFFRDVLAPWVPSLAAHPVEAAPVPPEGFFARRWFNVKNFFAGIGHWFGDLFRSRKGKLSPEYEQLLTKAIDNSAAGLDKLKNYQLPDGTYSWFEGSGTDLDMTLLVAFSLASTEDPYVMKQMGMEKTYYALQGARFRDDDVKAVMLAYVAAQLSRHGVLALTWESFDTRLKFQAERALREGTVLEQALLILTYKNLQAPMAGSVKELYDRLVENVKNKLSDGLQERGLEPAVWTPLARGWYQYPGRLSSSFAVAGHALSVAGAMDPTLKAQYAQALLKNFNGRNFGSTFETAQTLLHSAWIIREDIAQRADSSRPDVNVNGRGLSATELKAESGPAGWELSIPAAKLQAGENRIVLEDAEGLLAAQLVVYKDLPLRKTEAAARGFELARRYYRLTEGKAERTELKSGDTLKVGDLVYVELAFNDAKVKPWWASSYFVLKTHVPAGFAVIDQDDVFVAAPYKLPLRETRAKQRQIDSDEVQWYFSFEKGWMQNGRHVGFVMRASFEGEFEGGIAQIEDFYDETLVARSAAFRLRVRND